MERKYLFGLAGLALSFTVAFFGTRSINTNTNVGLPKTNAAPQTAPPNAGGGAPGGNTPDQKKQMGEVQGAIEKAKKNPKDFDAQMEVAGMYYQIGRYAETVEYLKRAYEANPTELGKKGALSFIGQFYFDEKKFDESATWFTRAVQADPNDNASKVFISVIKKDAHGADDALNKLKQAEPNSEMIPALQDMVADLKAGKPIGETKNDTAK